jgi:hypothetical protein
MCALCCLVCHRAAPCAPCPCALGCAQPMRRTVQTAACARCARHALKNARKKTVWPLCVTTTITPPCPLASPLSRGWRNCSASRKCYMMAAARPGARTDVHQRSMRANPNGDRGAADGFHRRVGATTASAATASAPRRRSLRRARSGRGERKRTAQPRAQ